LELRILKDLGAKTDRLDNKKAADVCHWAQVYMLGNITDLTADVK
jgi:hypothetical protein